MWIAPFQAPQYRLHVPHPRVQTGLATMVRNANAWLSLLAVVIYPMTYILTSYRWQLLLRRWTFA